ncbi:MAG: DUF899 domain-containing protein [Gammaproteobacteria bacterium]|nr:DUF899 domain-containing protein [Gammaproteobacteria bacterium]
MTHHPVVAHPAWLAARRELLEAEKAFTRSRDELARQRRALPWEAVTAAYEFATPQGPRSLDELFGASSQLFVYHFMLGPGWGEGCKSCSYLADHFDGMLPHLTRRDVAFVAVSSAPLAEIETFKARMGWRFPWVSAHGSDFNFDYDAASRPADLAAGRCTYNYAPREGDMTELPAASVFYRDGDGAVFHTYSCYARGLDLLIGTYNFLDLLPKGRDEDELDFSMSWVRHHDRYETPAG